MSDEALAAAWARLESVLRQPSGVFPGRWCASVAAGSQGEAVFDLCDLLLLCAAWRLRSPEIARELVLSAAAVQHPDGSFPRRVREDGHASDPRPAWPLFVRAADLAAGEFPPSDYAAVVLPAAERHVEWAWRYFGLEKGAAPQWPSAADAWLAETWSPAVWPVDLAAMLRSEVEACLALAERSNAGGAVRLRFGARARELARRLDQLHIDPESGEYRDRSAEGRPVARRTLSMFVPLLCPRLDSSRRRRLLDELGRWWDPATASFPAWERWAEDPLPPPVLCRQQALIWLALTEHTVMLGPEWRERAAAAAAAPWAATEVAGAVAAVLAASLRDQLPARSAVPSARRLWLAGAASLAGVGILVASGVYMIRRPSLPGATGEALLNLARERYVAGDHQQAITLYREFLARSRSTNGTVRVLLANALYRVGQYREAEELYRAALLEEVSALHALYNLGLTLHQQGRDEEAADVLERFAFTYRDDYPELARRARTAVAIIRRMPIETIGLP
ncbi:MAG: tetratricopeptide repeat protein [Kiritimatiellae bacterium]|nr:tetratricopeptide repeat protein [Kiritimatiellia bacterium]